MAEHADTTGFKDTGAYEDEGQHLQTAFPPASAFGGPGRFAFEPAATLNIPHGTELDDARDILLREWGAYYDLSKPVLLEKSPPNLIRADYFRALFPGSLFAFVVRHPICCALATQKWSKTSLTELILHWTIAHRRMLESLRGNDTVLLRYEDMVASPQPLLDGVARHAGLAAFTANEAVSDRNHAYFSRWTTKHAEVARQLDHVLPETVSFASRFGYDFKEPFVSPIKDNGLPWIKSDAGNSAVSLKG